MSSAVAIAPQIMIDLIDLAAQAENQRRRNIRMSEHALERALQLFGIRADGMAAAFAVRERHDAIDIFRQRSHRQNFRRSTRPYAPRNCWPQPPRCSCACPRGRPRAGSREKFQTIRRGGAMGLSVDRHFGSVEFLVAQIVHVHMFARLNSR